MSFHNRNVTDSPMCDITPSKFVQAAIFLLIFVGHRFEHRSITVILMLSSAFSSWEGGGTRLFEMGNKCLLANAYLPITNDHASTSFNFPSYQSQYIKVKRQEMQEKLKLD